MDKDILIIFCPPLSQYESQPNDQSKCELIDCPNCKKPMWLSEKKKGAIAVSYEFKKDILLLCYICMKEKIMKNPDIMKDHKLINL